MVSEQSHVDLSFGPLLLDEEIPGPRAPRSPTAPNPDMYFYL